MRTHIVSRLAALLACAVMTACVDTRSSGIPTTPEPAVTGATAPRPDLQTTSAAACTPVTAAQLVDLAVAAFGAGSPDVSSVIGKIGQLESAVLAGDYAAARQVAFNIIEFTLRKNSQRALGGSPAAITAFINAVGCYAGLNFVLDDLDGISIVQPSDGARIVYSADRLAGISLAANTLQEETIFSIVPIPFVPTSPGDGPLNTKLDQYRGFYNFQKLSANNLPLLQNLIVGVCAPATLSADIFARLRLGHDALAGFRLEPPANADFLSCATAYTAAAPTTNFFAPGLLGRVAALFTPRVAFAAGSGTFFAAGGVGGLASELSPFAPVDATVSFAGGVGGLASELRILRIEPAPGSCSGTEAPAGNAIEAACRPKVMLSTELGTPLSGAPVTFTATVGGGTVALQNADGSCGTFANSVIATTLGDGSAQVCWTLGSTPGQNRLRAVGGIGGDVPAGATYADARFFTAAGNPPTGLAFMEAPASGASIVAGTNIPVKVALVDRNGVTVTNFAGQVTLALRRAGAAAAFSASTQTLTTAVNGVATFSPVSITVAGTGYSLRATGSASGTDYLVDGNSFDVVSSTVATLTKVLGDNQTALAGTLLPVSPTVLVRDVFGNAVAGAVVSWQPGGSSAGSVSPPQSTTGADGRASTAWTVGAGSNELLATSATSSVLFAATGSSASLAVLNQCLPTGGGDPLNVPSKPFAFFIPDPGNNRTIREITVFLSSAGQANDVTRHDIQLLITRGTFNPADPSMRTETAIAFLRGSNNETKPITFTLREPIVGASGPNARKVMLRLSEVGPNAGAVTLNFNTGSCSPNSTRCNVPNICKVTEVSSPLPYPEGTFYRQSVGITVRGN